MTEVSATAKVKDEAGNVTGEVEATINYDFGETLQESIDLFGEEVVFTNFKQSAIIACQSRMRAAMIGGKDTAGKTGDELQAAIAEWKPGVKSMSRKSPVDKLKALLEGKSPEEIATLLQSAGVDFDDAEEEEFVEDQS